MRFTYSLSYVVNPAPCTVHQSGCPRQKSYVSVVDVVQPCLLMVTWYDMSMLFGKCLFSMLYNIVPVLHGTSLFSMWYSSMPVYPTCTAPPPDTCATHPSLPTVSANMTSFLKMDSNAGMCPVTRQMPPVHHCTWQLPQTHQELKNSTTKCFPCSLRLAHSFAQDNVAQELFK